MSFVVTNTAYGNSVYVTASSFCVPFFIVVRSPNS